MIDFRHYKTIELLVKDDCIVDATIALGEVLERDGEQGLINNGAMMLVGKIIGAIHQNESLVLINDLLPINGATANDQSEIITETTE